MSAQKFFAYIEACAASFLSLPRKSTIRLVSHYDCDGISACAIMVKALSRLNYRFTLSSVPQLDEKTFQKLKAENPDVVVFMDLGSGQLEKVAGHLPMPVFILDHHQFSPAKIPDNIMHVNPNAYSLKGSAEICGAGVTYLFCKALSKENTDMAHIAVIGAIGDVQENHGFTGLNQQILSDAVNSGRIEVEPGLRLFGINTRSLVKTLQFSSEVPGISSESEAVQFLQEMDINPRKGSSWRKYSDLSQHEIKKLISSIVMNRLDTKQPEAVVGPRYILVQENRDSPLRDAKEFATLLNACGRMGKVSLGIGVCINDSRLKSKAIQLLNSYKRQILRNLEWFRQAKKDEVIKGSGYIIINARENVIPTMIGTLASMVAKSPDVKQGTYVLGISHVLDGTSKFSIRVSGDTYGSSLNEVASQIAQTVDGYGGGHSYAAGGLIQTEKEAEFLKNARKILRQASMEELVQ